MKHTALLCLLLTACTHTVEHPTKGDAEFRDDLLDCETRAAPIQPPARASDFIGRCLKAKGWERTRRRP